MPAQNLMNRRRLRRAAGDPLGILAPSPVDPRSGNGGAQTGPSGNLFNPGEAPEGSSRVNPQREMDSLFRKGADGNPFRKPAGGPPEESPERQARRRRRRVG